LWRDPGDVSHCRILSPDKTEWRLISATLCRWRRCFVADQLWFMKRIREEEDWHVNHLTSYLQLGHCFIIVVVIQINNALITNNLRIVVHYRLSIQAVFRRCIVKCHFTSVCSGDFPVAIETLVTAISLIKQSKIAADDRCKILISSLQDTLHGIESNSYGSKYVLLFLPYDAMQELCCLPLSSVSGSEKNQFWCVWSDCEPVIWGEKPWWCVSLDSRHQLALWGEEVRNRIFRYSPPAGIA